MAEQTETNQKTFLEKVMSQTGLQTTNETQVATKVVFRILRDLMPTEEIDKVEQELKTEAPKADMEIADLWNDPNVMVAFFSRVSPLRQLSIDRDTFMLRLKQEGALPETAEPESVTRAVFSATKEELPQERITEVANLLPEGIRQLWEQA